MPVISQLAVSGYRSLRDIKLLLAPLTIITGVAGAVEGLSAARRGHQFGPI